MPQVNEFSWIFLSLQMSVLFLFIYLCLSYYVCNSKIYNSKFLLNYYSCLI